jgi:hypothetical protein
MYVILADAVPTTRRVGSSILYVYTVCTRLCQKHQHVILQPYTYYISTYTLQKLVQESTAMPGMYYGSWPCSRDGRTPLFV